MKRIYLLILVMMCLTSQLFAVTERELFSNAVELLQQGDEQGAVDAFTQLIQLLPESPDAYRNRGVAYLEMKQFDSAIHDFEKAIELKPKLEGLYSNMAVAWYLKKEYLRAIDFYNEDLALRPKNHIIYLNRALCWAALNDYNKGIADVDKYLEISPDDYPALCLKGDLLSNSGRNDQAIQIYEKAIAVEENHGYAKKQLAVLRQDIQDHGNISASSSSPEESGYALQVGAFLGKANAETLLTEIEEKGYEARILELSDSKGRTWFLTRIGSFKSRAQAVQYRDKIKIDFGSDMIISPLGQF